MIAALVLATAVNTHATVQLRAPDALTRNAPNEIAIEFQIQPDWHIYWENPGDSGEEPRAKWQGEGAKVGALEYPIPVRLPAGPFTNFGFSSTKDHPVVFRVPVHVDSTKDHLDLSLALTYLVCQESCVPEKADLQIKVPIVDKGTWKLSFAERDFPKREHLGSRTEPHRAVFSLRESLLRMKLPHEWRSRSTEFFPLTTQALMASDAGKFAATDGVLEIQTDPSVTEIPEKIVGLLVDRATSRAEWIELNREEPFDLATLFRSVSFALLGGFLLNLMPCVFPVVSLKVLSFVREGASEPREVRRHAYAYTAGIVLSLWALVVTLLLIRSAGTAIGWGFQLQNPSFLFLLLGVFFVLGLNLVGVFDINYQGPARLQNLMMKRGYGGSFFTGLLTTVVATPCSAPFMGVAIGAALAGGALQVFVVFTSLAIGLSAPYLFLAFRPTWVAKLPRPGAWMETLRALLAFPLFLTAVWLFWVLSQTVDIGALVLILVWCTFASFFAWSLRLVKTSYFNLVVRAVAILALIGASGVTLATLRTNPTETAQVQGTVWEPYSDARLKSELAAGKSVFVDFTASWCVTCQVNKRLVLETETGDSLFKVNNVVRLRADWTRRDLEITNALSRLGRNSVPVYAYYRNGSPEARLLPEILTTEILKSALEEK